MRAAFRSPAAVLALLLLPACDDPLDPCDEFGCGVEGVDLALVEAEIEWTADQPVDDRVGGRLVQPGDEMTFRYHILNRGTEPSDESLLFVGTWHNEGNLGVDLRFLEWLMVPSLEPGESFAGELTKLAPNTLRLRTDESRAEFRIESHGGPFWYDEDLSNNYRSFEYHVALPYVTLQTGGSADTLVLGEPRVLEVIVRNESPVAPLTAGAPVRVCLRMWIEQYGGLDCGTDWIELQHLPELVAVPGPGHAAVATGTVVIPEGAIFFADDPISHPALRACVDRACDDLLLPAVRPGE